MDFQKIREKIGSSFEVQPPNSLYLHDSTEQRTNEFGGTTVVAPMGEGILIFYHADFHSAFIHCTVARQELTRTVDNPEAFSSF